MDTNSPRARIIRSLRFRILIGAIIVIAMTTVISAWFATYSVTERFRRFVIQNEDEFNTFLDENITSRRENGLVLELYYLDDGIDQQEFINSVTQALFFVVLITGFVTLALILTLAHPGLQMIEALTAASRRLAAGDHNHRVEIRTHDEIGQLARSFNDMADSLAHIEKLRSTMVSDIAHELRTPLSNIQGYMEGLRDGVIPPQPELFQSLYEESALLTRLVNDLQLLTLAEARQLNLVKQSVNVKTIVTKTINAIESETDEQPPIEVLIPSEIPPIYIDPDRFIQILRNLVQNAIIHTPKDGRISVEAYKRGEMINIIVTDTGYGIEPQHLEYVFERFYRTDKSRTRATGGSGIGLAIVKQLVEAHGGHVWVESHVGQGSTFGFSIPVYKQNHAHT